MKFAMELHHWCCGGIVLLALHIFLGYTRHTVFYLYSAYFTPTRMRTFI
jgi:hypothetical protein